MALALRRRTHIKECSAVLLNPDSCRFAASKPGRFHAASDPDPDQPPIGKLRSLPQFLEGQLQEPRIVAAVVDEPTPTGRITGRERDLLWLDEVATSQLG